jgi:hypothetical protein
MCRCGVNHDDQLRQEKQLDVAWLACRFWLRVINTHVNQKAAGEFKSLRLFYFLERGKTDETDKGNA